MYTLSVFVRESLSSLNRPQKGRRKLSRLAPVVQKVDNGIHCISHYPLDNAIGLPKTSKTYPLDMVYPVDSATLISCRAYTLLNSKPLLSNMYLYFRTSQYIFFSRLPYYVHK